MDVCLGSWGFYLAVFIYWILGLTEESAASCPEGPNQQLRENCYILQPDSSTWNDARERCKLQGGTLPVVTDDVTQDFLAMLMRKKDLGTLWLDGRETVKDWYWTKDGSVISHQGCYRHVPPWMNDLKFTTEINDMVPTKCMDECRSRGELYAGIQSKTECYCGNKYGEISVLATDKTDSWCSVTCPGNGTLHCGGWGKTSIYNVNGGYSAWGYRQPDVTHSSCAVLDKSGNDRTFADEYCYLRLNFICDIPKSSCASSGDSYYFKDDKCLFIGKSVSWWNANNKCHQMQGNLVSITNNAKHRLVNEAVKNFGPDEQFWIGLTRSNWTWSSSGTSFLYTNWAEKSPGNIESNCLIITKNTGFKWSDTSCDESHPTLCSIPVMTTIGPTTETTAASTNILSTNTEGTVDYTADITNKSSTTTDNPTDATQTGLDSITIQNATTDETSTATSELKTTTSEIFASNSTSREDNSSLLTNSYLVNSTEFMEMMSSVTPTGEREGKTESNYTTEFGETLNDTSTMSTTLITNETENSTTVIPSTGSGKNNNVTDLLGSVTIGENVTQFTNTLPLETSTENYAKTSEIPEYQYTSKTSSTHVYNNNSSLLNMTTSALTNVTMENDTLSPTELPMVTSEKFQDLSSLPFPSTNATATTKLATDTANETNSTLYTGTTESYGYSDLSTDVNSFSNDTITDENINVTHESTSSSLQTSETLSSSAMNDRVTTADATSRGEPEETSLNPTAISSHSFTVTDSSNLTTASPFNITTESEAATTNNALTDTKFPRDTHNSANGTQGLDNVTETNEYETVHSEGTESFQNNESHIYTESSPATTQSFSTETVHNRTNEASGVVDSYGEITTDATTDKSLNPSTTNQQNNHNPLTSASLGSENASVVETVTHAYRNATSFEDIASTVNGSLSRTSGGGGEIPEQGKTQPNRELHTDSTRHTTASVSRSTLLSTILYRAGETSEDGGGEYTGNATGITSVWNDGNSTSFPGVEQTKEGDSDSGWSVFEIVVVAGLVFLALGLATSMVVFLSCKKRSGRRKSNEAASGQTPSQNPPLGGATRVDIFSANGFGLQNNGFSPDHDLRGEDRKKKKRGEKYKVLDDAESQDISTMEDIRVHRSPSDRDGAKKPKKKRELSPKKHQGSNPAQEWNTLPRYYYGMGKDRPKNANGNSGDPGDHLGAYVHKQFPLRQEVYFKMSQVFGEHSGPNGQMAGQTHKADSDRAPTIYFVGDKRLYDNASQYGNLTNMQSFSLPRQNGNVIHVPDNKRLYEQAAMSKKAPPSVYDRRKVSGVPGQVQSGPPRKARAHSFSSHHAIGSADQSGKPENDVNHRNGSIQRTSSDSFTLFNRNPYNIDKSHSPVSDANRSTVLKKSRPGSFRQRISPADIVIPLPPTVPNGRSKPGKKPPPPKPPRDRSPTSNQQEDTRPKTRLKPYVAQEVGGAANGTNKKLVLNAEEGITWC